jgi:uncharacterized protein (TIGR02145 family)
MKQFLLIIFLAIVLNINAQTVSDADGHNYKTTTISKQVWMASNLNVTHFLNGDIIPQATTNEEWATAAKEGKPAWCYYNNDTANAKYGKLYNYFAIIDKRGIAPKGYHVPALVNYQTLVKFLGGIDAAGSKLKSLTNWSSGGNGSNTTGFSATPGGNRLTAGKYMELGSRAYFWTTSDVGGNLGQIYAFSLISSSSDVMYIKLDKTSGCSVRCIKD